MTPQEAIPSLIERPEGAIVFWVIFDHPPDYPNAWVLRPQIVVGKEIAKSDLAWFAADIDQLHAILPPNCIRMGPYPGEDPSIAEVWME